MIWRIFWSLENILASGDCFELHRIIFKYNEIHGQSICHKGSRDDCKIHTKKDKRIERHVRGGAGSTNFEKAIFLCMENKILIYQQDTKRKQKTLCLSH